MATHRLAHLAALAGLVAASTGCATPFTGAVAEYASATTGSTGALDTVPSTASRLCRREAHLSYLHRRFKGEPVPGWVDFYAKDLATTTKLTWKDYCAEIDATGPLFAAGVTAISTYASALGTLAGSGEYKANDISDLANNASSIAGSLGQKSLSGAMQPVGQILQQFAQFFVAAYTDHKIQGYVTRADPTVQVLLDKLIAYVDALQTSLVSVDDTLRQEIEARAEQGLVGEPGAGAKVDAARLLELYAFATTMDRDAWKTRSAITGYRNVLGQMKVAHTKLAKAAATDQLAEAKDAISSVATLLTQLHALQGALSQ